MDCLFCKIARGEIPAKIAYQNAHVVAFDDISPQAPIHKIIIPIKHLSTLNDTGEHDTHLIAEMSRAAITLAKELGIAEDGYRVVMNCNPLGGQSVYHIHMHLLGGRQLSWPPG